MLNKILCYIFGHVDIEPSTSMSIISLGNSSTIKPTTIQFRFIDKYDTKYMLEMVPCKRCIVYWKKYKENDLTDTERIIKDIIE